jgi:hypothetical protein
MNFIDKPDKIKISLEELKRLDDDKMKCEIEAMYELEHWESDRIKCKIAEKLYKLNDPAKIKRKIPIPSTEEIRKCDEEWLKLHPTYLKDLHIGIDDEELYDDYIPTCPN